MLAPRPAAQHASLCPTGTAPPPPRPVQVFSRGAKFSLFKPAEEMVYIGLDDESRTKGKAAIDVVGAQSGKSIGSMLQQALLILRWAGATCLGRGQGSPGNDCSRWAEASAAADGWVTRGRCTAPLPAVARACA